MATRSSSSGPTSKTASDTPDTPDTSDTSTEAQVEVSDSGVDTSLLTEQQKAVLEFQPVELTRGERTVTARTQSQLVSLEFDGYTRKSDK